MSCRTSGVLEAPYDWRPSLGVVPVALSQDLEHQLRQAVRDYLEASALAADNPAVAPAAAYRAVALGGIVDPVVGPTERSLTMMGEFASCWGSLVSATIWLLGEHGVKVDLDEFIRSVLAPRPEAL